MIAPPRDVPPERLFRLLLRAPRARLPVDLTLAGERRAGLFVYAPTLIEELGAAEVGLGKPEGLRQQLYFAELAAIALHDDRGQVFESGEALCSAIEEQEFDALFREVIDKLAIIAPSRHRSDIDAWKRDLAEGARHRSNQYVAWQLAACVDLAWRKGNIPRPDRFWGRSVAELTEGQVLCFRAARFVCVDEPF